MTLVALAVDDYKRRRVPSLCHPGIEVMLDTCFHDWLVSARSTRTATAYLHRVSCVRVRLVRYYESFPFRRRYRVTPHTYPTCQSAHPNPSLTRRTRHSVNTFPGSTCVAATLDAETKACACIRLLVNACVNGLLALQKKGEQLLIEETVRFRASPGYPPKCYQA